MSSVNRLTPLPPISASSDSISMESKAKAGEANEPIPQTGPAAKTTAPVKLDLSKVSVEDLFSEMEKRTAQLKVLTDFSTADCGRDIQYLQAASRYGSSAEV